VPVRGVMFVNKSVPLAASRFGAAGAFPAYFPCRPSSDVVGRDTFGEVTKEASREGLASTNGATVQITRLAGLPLGRSADFSYV
jgi:hypothetical protein